jgi:hypothetical protein
MTKKEICQMTIHDFIENELNNNEKLNDKHILQSTSLGIAMEYLELLKEDWAKEYISSN